MKVRTRIGKSRNALLAILCGLVLAATVAPAASSAAEIHHVAISLANGDHVFEGTGTFTSATTLVVSGSGADLGSWSKVEGLEVTVTRAGSGDVMRYDVVYAWPPSAESRGYSKTLTFTLSTTTQP